MGVYWHRDSMLLPGKHHPNASTGIDFSPISHTWKLGGDIDSSKLIIKA